MPLLSNRSLRGTERDKEIGKEIGALQNARDYIKAVLQVLFGEVSFDIDSSLDQVSDLSVLDELLKLGLLNKDEILARQYFQAFYKRSDARLWHLEAQNPCTLLEKCEVKLETDL
jgi:hypothetical protein